MNKNTIHKKLNLHRETLVNLQPEELEHVNGGTNTSVVVRSTIKLTSIVSRATSRATKQTVTTTTTVASHPKITCPDH